MTTARERLEELGYEVLVFHQTGAGGGSMEKLIEAGFIAGSLDVTTTEFCDLVAGGVLAAVPERLESAGARGIPQVVSLGALDMVNFGPLDTVPERYRDRNLYVHNPTITLMRTTPDECRESLPNVRWRVPSGRAWRVHVKLQPSPGGSHSSPQATLTTPSPHCPPDSIAHVAEQPSQLVRLPSSHASVPQRTPSPQPLSTRQFDAAAVAVVRRCRRRTPRPPSSEPSPQPATRWHSDAAPLGTGGSHSSPQAALIIAVAAAQAGLELRTPPSSRRSRRCCRRRTLRRRTPRRRRSRVSSTTRRAAAVAVGGVAVVALLAELEPPLPQLGASAAAARS